MFEKDFNNEAIPPPRHTNRAAVDALIDVILDSMCNDDSATEERRVTAKIMRAYNHIGSTLSAIVNKYAMDLGADFITFSDRQRVLEHLETVEAGLKQLLTADGLQKETT